MLDVNCKDCLYRKFLDQEADDHVWGEDCDHYKDDFCKKMNDPDFIAWQKSKEVEHG